MEKDSDDWEITWKAKKKINMETGEALQLYMLPVHVKDRKVSKTLEAQCRVIVFARE